MSNQANLKNLVNGRVKLSTVLDRIEEKMIAQNAQSINGTNCKYFAKDGKRCAIGCILPKSAKKVNIEGTRISGLLHKLKYEFKCSESEKCKIITILHAVQQAHDHYASFMKISFADHFKEKMKKIRVKYADYLKDH